jgi:rhodanese-related sulfurtransferase
MAAWFSRLTLNQTLALAAFVLGALAIFAVPYRGGKATIDTRALALEVSTGADQVEPLELAAWIVESHADYRLIDVRDETAFQQYHIPTAENVPMASLPDLPLGSRDKAVLYSDEGVHAAQGWLLLRAKGLKGVYLLKGGLSAWKTQVLFPTLTENPSPDQQARDEELKAMSTFFGGQARVGSQASQTGGFASMPTTTAPKVAPPLSPAANAKPAAKKKEGC